MTSIQEQIQNTIEEIVRLDKAEKQLSITQESLDTAYQAKEDMNKLLDKELRDIEKLEGFSTKAIFYKVLGSKQEQVEKERQEYLELVLKSEDIDNEIQLLEYEVNLLEAKVGSREEFEANLERLKLEREAEIIETDPGLRSALLKISNHLENQYYLKQEIEEAI